MVMAYMLQLVVQAVQQQQFQVLMAQLGFQELQRHYQLVTIQL